MRNGLAVYEMAHAYSNVGTVYGLRNKLLRELGYASYQDYLQSERWKKIRARALQKNKGRCVHCGKPATQVHHSKYDRKGLMGNSLKHLWPVCGDDHAAAERKPDGSKTTIYAANLALGTVTKAQVHFWSKVCPRCNRHKLGEGLTICRPCMRAESAVE